MKSFKQWEKGELLETSAIRCSNVYIINLSFIQLFIVYKSEYQLVQEDV